MRVDDVEMLIRSIAGEGVSKMFKKYAQQAEGEDTEKIAFALEVLEKLFGISTLVPIMMFVGKNLNLQHSTEADGGKLKVVCPFEKLSINKKPLEHPLCYLCWGSLHTFGNPQFGGQEESKCIFIVEPKERFLAL